MNNDFPPAWNMGKVLTINCESSLGGLMIQSEIQRYISDLYLTIDYRATTYMGLEMD